MKRGENEYVCFGFKIGEREMRAGRFCGWEMPTFLIIIILYRHNGYVQDGLEKSCTILIGQLTKDKMQVCQVFPLV